MDPDILRSRCTARCVLREDDRFLQPSGMVEATWRISTAPQNWETKRERKLLTTSVLEEIAISLHTAFAAAGSNISEQSKEAGKSQRGSPEMLRFRRAGSEQRKHPKSSNVFKRDRSRVTWDSLHEDASMSRTYEGTRETGGLSQCASR